jgi:hypothetical protein
MGTVPALRCCLRIGPWLTSLTVERANEFEAALHRIAAPSTQSASQDVTGTSPLAQAAQVVSVPARSISAASRLARLLPTRSPSVPPPSSAPLQASATPHTPNAYPHSASLPFSTPPTELDLINALTHEKNLRIAAESAVRETNSELEELTGQLFEQANEMVAAERKARAKLEERVLVLEKRDGDKSKRLSLLESRVQRVERVRALLEKEKGQGDRREAHTEENDRAAGLGDDRRGGPLKGEDTSIS